MLYEYFDANGVVYGTKPIYVNGEPTNPFVGMLDITREYNLTCLSYRIKCVDVR